ncbi:MAG: DNA repair protein RecO [Thermodesulfobacteriota bacterium]
MKRGYNTTGAIVLNAIDYGESDRIVTFYTADYGKVTGIAKGARRSKKRFVNKLEPFSHITLTFFHKEGRELVRIEECRLRNDFHRLKDNLEGLAYGSYMLELLGAMTREGERHEGVFTLLLAALEMVQGEGDPEKGALIFETRLLSLLGYRPRLDGCLLCSRLSDGTRYYFSSHRGGMVCDACRGGMPELLPLSLGTARFLDATARMDIRKVGRLIPNPVVVRESISVLRDFVRYHVGRELKTRQFLDRIKGLDHTIAAPVKC